MSTSSLFFILVGAIVLVLLLRWLLRPSNNEFNAALEKYKELKRILPSPNADPYELLDTAFDVIYSLQIAIKNDPQNFDSYIVLANVYYSLGLRFRETGIFTICYRFATAVMMFWKENSTYTRNQSKGEYLWSIISKDFQEIRKWELMGKQPALLLQVLNGDFRESFNQAINPQVLPITKKFVVAWHKLDLAVDMIDVNNKDKSSLALEICDDVIGENPDMGPAYFTRAQAHAALGNHEQTIKDIDSFEEFEGPNEYSIATRKLSRQVLEDLDKASLRISVDLLDLDLGETKAPLENADLLGAELVEAILTGAQLRGANFAGANLYEAKLAKANLVGVNLIGANLRRADLYGARLRRANLAGASLAGANLYGAMLFAADLKGASLLGANLYGADLIGANLEGADLGRTNLTGTALWNANLEKASLRGADLLNADLREATLTKTDLRGTRLYAANLAGANLTGALYDNDTQWPDDFDPKSKGAVNRDEMSGEEEREYLKYYLRKE